MKLLPSWKTILKPDQSVVTSLAVAGGVLAVYTTSLPSMVEIHAAPAHNASVASSQRKAMWTSAALVGGAYLLTRDPNVFVAGGVAFVSIEWLFRHANGVDPRSGKVVSRDGSGHGSQDTADTGYFDNPDDSDYA